MIVDGQGSPASSFTEHWSGASECPATGAKCRRFYRADRKRVECIGKQLWDCDNERLVGLGMFYFLLTQAIFPGEGNEGKVMGLAPHGDPRRAGHATAATSTAAQVNIPAAWREVLRERGRFRYSGADDSTLRRASPTWPPPASAPSKKRCSK